MKRRFFLISAMLIVPRLSHAQTSEPESGLSLTGEAREPTKEEKAEAERYFLKGYELLESGAFAPALDAFVRSRELYAGKSSLKNIAVCLRELRRYDDASDVYEQLLRVPNLKPDEKREAQEYLAEMRSRIGTIEIVGAEIGAGITVDGQAKGEFPPPDPIRAPTGSHVLRLYKEDFEPYEVNVDVQGGKIKTIDVKMIPLTSSGRLSVVEQSGRTIDVYIDGLKTGKTPWEGRIGVGRHTVTLVGPGNFGTQPASVDVKPQQLATLKLPGKILDASLQVTPSPIDARVSIDNVEVGIGSWSGRLDAGKHKIDIQKDGFIAESRYVVLKPGDRPQMKIAIERDQNAAVWRLPSLVTFEVSSGFSISPSFGGDVPDSTCTDGCVSSPAMGSLSRLSVAYERESKLAFGADLGYWYARQTVQNRDVALSPVGLDPQDGSANDSIRLHGPMVGAHFGYRGLVKKNWPFGLRIGMGALFADLRDDRAAKNFTSKQTDVVGNAQNVSISIVDASAIYLYAYPEAYAGVRLGKHFELGATLGAFIAYTWQQPKFNDQLPIPMSVPVTESGAEVQRPTYTTFGPETLTGPVIFSGVFGLRARADF